MSESKPPDDPSPHDADPHRALDNPATDPDPTEWPDPYDHREDPRAPADDMVFPGDGRSHTPVGSTSDSEPLPDEDIEAIRTHPPERDHLDE
jgi:hypothetical protein